MNFGITSREAILQACRRLIAEQGLDALSMRAAAQNSGIALGTLYNYFSDKDELLIAAIESIWMHIFHSDESDEATVSFSDYVTRLYSRMRKGAAQYPNFLTAHSASIAAGKRGEAKSIMDGCFTRIKAALTEALHSDPQVCSDAFSQDLTEKDWIDLVMDQLLLTLLRGKPDCSSLTELIRRVLYC